MKHGLIVAISVIAGLPLCAEAQQPSSAKAKAAAQKVVKMIIGDKAKSQIYCDIVKVGEQIEQTDPTDTKKTDELYQHVDELATKLGPDYTALMDGLQDMDPDSEEGKEIGSTLDVLNKLCAK
jgi:DNA repair ATPase RecN